jgi:hypothetical protein
VFVLVAIIKLGLLVKRTSCNEKDLPKQIAQLQSVAINKPRLSWVGATKGRSDQSNRPYRENSQDET